MPDSETMNQPTTEPISTDATNQNFPALRGGTLPPGGGSVTFQDICGIDGLGTSHPIRRSGMPGLSSFEAPDCFDRPEARVGESQIRVAESGGNRSGTSPIDSTKHRTTKHRPNR